MIELTESEMLQRLASFKIYPGTDPNATTKKVYDEVMRSIELLRSGYGSDGNI